MRDPCIARRTGIVDWRGLRLQWRVSVLTFDTIDDWLIYHCFTASQVTMHYIWWWRISLQIMSYKKWSKWPSRRSESYWYSGSGHKLPLYGNLRTANIFCLNWKSTWSRHRLAHRVTMATALDPLAEVRMVTCNWYDAGWRLDAIMVGVGMNGNGIISFWHHFLIYLLHQTLTKLHP